MEKVVREKGEKEGETGRREMTQEGGEGERRVG